MTPSGSAIRGLEHLPTDRMVVMGIVNVTPDSFSDGGSWLDPHQAISHARSLLDRGADVLDLGGESTRPGAARVSTEEQLRRLLPVVEELAGSGAVLSVDTTDAEVARRTLAAGAHIINDVSGGLADPAMFEVVAAAGAPYVLMHWRGHSADMASRANYSDVTAEVVAELEAQLAAFVAAGGEASQVILDPGLGFAKDAGHNWELLRGLDALDRLGRPILVGASRKRFLGELLAEHGLPHEPVERDPATAALSAVLAQRGIWGVRVHDVGPSVDAARVVAELRNPRGDR